MRQSIKTRRAAQVTYQRAYRLQQTALRKPSRDDVARVALHWIIDEALGHDQAGELGIWCETLVTRLVAQGFERNAARRRVHHLIAQYEDGWDFQRKPQLTRAGED